MALPPKKSGKTILAAGYHTPLYHDGLIFGVSSAKTFFCVDAKSGTELWKDNTRRGECAPSSMSAPSSCP